MANTQRGFHKRAVSAGSTAPVRTYIDNRQFGLDSTDASQLESCTEGRSLHVEAGLQQTVGAAALRNTNRTEMTVGNTV